MNVFLVCAFALAVDATQSAVKGSDMVGKVVKLLEDMQQELQSEAKKDEANYDKLVCWCETNTKEKTQSVDDATVAISSAESEIESRIARAERLKKDIASKEASAATILESLDSSSAQRDKDGAANQAEIVQLTKNLEMLKGAIIVLKKHQAAEFPQIKVSALQEERPSAMDKLSAFMGAHDYGHLSSEDEHRVDAYEAGQRATLYGGYSLAELRTLEGAKKLVKSFAQVSAKGHSGEIFGVLTTMKEQMARDLKELEATEAQAVADYDAMTVNLKEQLKQEEGNAKRKTAEAGANGKALSVAKTSHEDNTNTAAADTDFLANLKKTCGDLDAQFQQMRKTRTEEITAVSEAMSILTQDEASEENAEQQKGVAFLQMISVRSRSNVRLLAAQMLQKTAAKTKNAALVELSVAVQLDGFEKVKKAINQMVEDLKLEQADEVKHKDFCNQETHQNEMDTMAAGQSEKDLTAAINLLADQIGTLKTDIKTVRGEIAQGTVDLQQASMDRAEESQQFIQTVADQRAAKTILEKALMRLEDFYGRRDAFLQKALLRGTHKQTPPVTVGEYKKSSGAGPVVTMLQNIIHESEEIQTEAIATENEAQASYEQLVSESNASQKAKEGAVVNMGEQLAASEQEQVGKEADLAGVKREQEGLAATLGDLHKQCDFVIKNFELRQQARSSEIEALGQALAILSGA